MMRVKQIIASFACLILLVFSFGCENQEKINQQVDAGILARMKAEDAKQTESIMNDRKLYESQHTLRKMFASEEVTTSKSRKANVTGGFFLFFGGIDGNYEENEKKSVVSKVRFAWAIENDMYTVTSLPLDKIRIKLSERAITPSISFQLYNTPKETRWCKDNNAHSGDICIDVFKGKDLELFEDHMNPQGVLDEFLDYAVLTVSSKDWPTNVSLPMNGK